MSFAVAAVVMAIACSSAHASKVVDRVVGTTTAGSTGGLFNGPIRVAVNSTGAGGVAPGTFYVVDGQNFRIQRFSRAGEFQRAWGIDVELPAGGSAFEICTVAANCKAGVETADAGAIARPGALAVDGDSGHVYVSTQRNRRVDVFGADGTFLRAFGFDVAASGPGDTGTAFEICVPSDGDTCKAGVAGSGVGQYGDGLVANTFGLSVTPPDGNPATGKVYLANSSNRRVEVYDLDGTDPASFGSATDFTSPQRVAVGADGIVYVSDSANGHEIDAYDTVTSQFLTAIPAATITGGFSGSSSTIGLAIDVGSGNLFVARNRVALGIAEIAEPSSAPTVADRHPLALNPSAFSFDIAFNSATDELFVTTPDNRVLILDDDGASPPLLELGGTTNVGSTTATLNATIDSNGTLPTDYQLQVSRNGVEWTSAASGTVPASTSQDVSTTIDGLTPNTSYRARIVANKGFLNPDVVSPETTFLTDAVAPEILSTTADAVSDSSVRLTGYVNAHSRAATYHFEWGTQPGSYPNRVPIPSAPVGSGSEPVLAAQTVTGLQASTTYHFRLLARSSEGTGTGPEQSFTTRATPLSTRGVELVTPPDDGGVGAPTRFLGKGTFFQVAPSGDAIYYQFAYGTRDSTAPAVVKLMSRRSGNGWDTMQMTPGLFEDVFPNDRQGFFTGQSLFVTEDISCVALASAQALTPDASSVVRDHEGANLFLSIPGVGYRLLTPDVPTNVATQPVPLRDLNGGFWVGGVSDDCRRVVFESPYRYPGVNNTASITNWGIYGWEDGSLESISVLPDGSPAQNAIIGGYAGGGPGSKLHAVSDDGRRVYFTALSTDGNDSGKRALFLRDGGVTSKVSASETATVNQAASFEVASTTGSRAAFLANYGLSDTSGAGPVASDCSDRPPQPCALYVYDAEDEDLVDISADANPSDTNGATVVGVMAASDDLQRIYFAAQGQLVDGEGRTFAANLAQDSYNVYLWDHGTLVHVGLISGEDFHTQDPFLHDDGGDSQATPDGGRFVFPSSVNMTGYNGGGVAQAYLYSVATGELTCLSCRRDGDPSVGDASAMPLRRELVAEDAAPRLPRVMSDDGARIVFSSQDALTRGGVDGKINIYLWDRGALQLLTTGNFRAGGLEEQADPRVIGMTPSGDDIFITTPEPLDPTDEDGLADLYDFRVGGGFPQAPASPPPCAVLRDSCQSAGSPPVGVEPRTRVEGGAGQAKRSRVVLEVRGLSRRARRLAVRRGVLAVRVRSSAAGRVRAVAEGKIGPGKARRRLAATSRMVREGQATALRLRLNRIARQRLRRGGALRLTLRVTQPGARPRSMAIRLRGARS